MPTLQLAVDNRSSIQAFIDMRKAVEDNTRVLIDFRGHLVTTDKQGEKTAATFNYLKAAVAGFIAAVSVRGLFHLVKDTAEYADELGDLSKRIGVTSEFLSVLKHAAEQSGTSIEAFGTGIKFLEKQLNEFVVSGDEAIGQVIAVLGPEFEAAVKAGKPVESLILQLSKRLKELSEQERVTVGLELFGRQGTELLPPLLEDLEAVAGRVTQLGGVVTKEFVEKGDAFNDAIGDLKLSLIGLRNDAIGPLLPVLKDLVERLTSFVADHRDDVIRFFATFTRGLGDIVVGGGEVVIALHSVGAGVLTLGDRIELTALKAKKALIDANILQRGLTLQARIDAGEIDELDALREADRTGQRSYGQTLEGEIRSLENKIANNKIATDIDTNIRGAAAIVNRTLKDFAGDLDKNADDIEAKNKKLNENLVMGPVIKQIFGEGKEVDRSNLIRAAQEAAEKEQLKELNKERAKAAESIAETIRKTEEEVTVAGLAADERERALAIYAFERDLRKAGIVDIDDEIDAQERRIKTIQNAEKAQKELEHSRTEQKEFNKEYDKQVRQLELELSLLKEIESIRERVLAIAALEEQARERGIKLSEEQRVKLDELLKTVASERKLRSIADGIGDAFSNFTEKVIDDIRDVGGALEALVKDVQRAILQELLFKPIKENIAALVYNIVSSAVIAGAGTRGKSTGGGDSGGGDFGGETSHPDTPTALGAVIPLAYGGLFDRPTRFNARGRDYLAGESGTEGAVFPLERDGAGRLGVRAVGSEGQRTINMKVITPNADSFRKSKRQIARDIQRGLR